MTPRERYFAEQAAREEAERRAIAEAQRAEAARIRQAQLAEERRRYEAKMRRKRERERMERQRQARIFGGRFVLFAVMFLIILFITLLIIFVSFIKTNDGIFGGDSSDYKFYYLAGNADVETAPSWGQTADETLRDGVMYINFSKIADIVGMTVTGSGDERRYITVDGEEEVIFNSGDEIALVNSFAYRMEASAEASSDGISVPLSFVTETMSGVSVTIDDENNTVTLSSIKAIPTFVIKPADEIPPVSEEEEYGDTTAPDETDSDTDANANGDGVPAVEFVSDLSEYEEYMDPEDRDAYLVLVNAWNKLGEDDVPTDLYDVVNTRQDGRNTQKLRLYAAKALEALFIELYACGYDDKGPTGYPVSVMSAYRSYTYQNQLFNSYVDREMNDDPSLTRAEAEAITEKYSARPGTSEHQTGLCLDMHNLSSAQKAFADEEAYAWLEENCWKFGFILRFPEGKTDKTGITYEPWHYRYVGRYHAYRIHELDMCLEEYLDYIGQ